MARILTVDQQSLQLAQHIIAQGGVIAIPTDTVYGVACDPTSKEAVQRLFAVKHRPAQKTVQILVAQLSDIHQYGLSIPFPLDMVAQHFCPGGFSPICNVDDPDTALVTVRTQTDEHGNIHRTQAVRVPEHIEAQQILALCGPLAASSANISGMQAATSAQEVAQMLGDSVDLILDAGPTPGPVASTVCAYNAQEPQCMQILREGTIPATVVREFAQQVLAEYMNHEEHVMKHEERIAE